MYCIYTCTDTVIRVYWILARDALYCEVLFTGDGVFPQGATSSPLRLWSSPRRTRRSTEPSSCRTGSSSRLVSPFPPLPSQSKHEACQGLSQIELVFIVCIHCLFFNLPVIVFYLSILSFALCDCFSVQAKGCPWVTILSRGTTEKQIFGPLLNLCTYCDKIICLLNYNNFKKHT